MGAFSIMSEPFKKAREVELPGVLRHRLATKTYFSPILDRLKLETHPSRAAAPPLRHTAQFSEQQ